MFPLVIWKDNMIDFLGLGVTAKKKVRILSTLRTDREGGRNDVVKYAWP